MKCLCVTEPIPVYDESAGETVCDTCAVVLEEKAAQTVWERTSMTNYLGGFAPRQITKYVTTQRMADGSMHATRDALLCQLLRTLEHISAADIITDEAVMLVRRMCADGFAKGKHKTKLCAGIALTACRIHGRIIKREEIAEVTGTDFKRISRMARMITDRYDLKPLSVEERTRRIISQMCAGIGEPALLHSALCTYDSMLFKGCTSGKNPYVVAALALRVHTVRIMSDTRFAVAVGASFTHMNRYSEMIRNAC